METLILFIIFCSILGFLISIVRYYQIKSKDPGNKLMIYISGIIHEGAKTFLNKQYKIIVVFVLVVSILLGFLINLKIAFTFIIGAVLSALAGNIGMRIATLANGRTAQATKTSIYSGLNIAFSSGSVMGLTVVSLGLFGITILYLIFKDPTLLYGFGFGASSIALFARVGGGIYTKSADVGADLVGKVEKSIPEDDIRNPAVIADNVGDNVGDVAGMGADLFESYVDSIIASMVIGIVLFSDQGVLLPLSTAALGIICSLVGIYFVKHKRGNVENSMFIGILVATITMAFFSYFLVHHFIQIGVGNIGIYISILIGLVSGIIIGLSTNYFTSVNNKPVMNIAKASETGPATNIIQGLSSAMLSTIIPVITIALAIFFSFLVSGKYGLFGISIAAVGMLSTLAITLAADSFGPVADNAEGISEMAKLGPKIRKRTEKLDAIGNTTAAIGKGFAIGSAALTSLALFVSFTQIANIKTINVADPIVIIGLFMGALLPFIFSALTISAVGKAASKIVLEVRHQFKTIPGLITGKSKPNYNKCIEISTHYALKEMILPSLIAIISPIIVGLIFGVEAVGGLLVGSLVTGFLLAIFMANAGGSWDNAKKYIESGHLGGKGSPIHKSAIIGDTVGDPLKDTSGPSLNILIKLIAIVALIFLPLFL